MNRRGFTLIELMVVLVLLAVTATAAIPAMLAERHVSDERRVATQLAELLVEVRDAARSTGKTATLDLAPGDARFWVDTPNGARTGTLALGATRLSPGPARIACAFTAAGAATPCDIHLRGSTALDVRIDAWTGEVRIIDAQP